MPPAEVTLSEALTAEGVQGWLTDITSLINTLEGMFVDGQRAATVNVAFAASFFQTSAGAPRFELTVAQIPVELATPPSLPALSGVALVTGDVLFYISASPTPQSPRSRAACPPRTARDRLGFARARLPARRWPRTVRFP